MMQHALAYPDWLARLAVLSVHLNLSIGERSSPHLKEQSVKYLKIHGHGVNVQVCMVKFLDSLEKYVKRR